MVGKYNLNLLLFLKVIYMTMLCHVCEATLVFVEALNR